MATRRLRLAVLVTACAVFAAGCDWTMYGYGPTHTRANPWETRITAGRVDTLTTKWTRTTAGAVRSSPAIANGVAYVGSDKVYAIDALTGATLWTANVKDGGGSSPAVANGVVYVGSDDGKLYALDAVTGSTLWVAPTGGAVSSSPAVTKGVVYVGSADGKLYAFDAAGMTACSGAPKSCAPLWVAPTGGPVSSSPAVANGVVYVGSADGNVYAFDSVTGATRWVAPTGAELVSSPAVAQGVVYVGSTDGKLYAFDAAGNVGCSGSPKSCVPLWIGPTGGPLSSSPAVARSEVYVGSTDGKLYAFDAAGTTGCSGVPKSCAPLWVGPTGGAVAGSPAVATNVVYVGSDDGSVYAFFAGDIACPGIPASCAPLWVAPTGGAVRSSPAVVDGFVYVGSDDGRLYEFGLSKFFLNYRLPHLPDKLSPGESGTDSRGCFEGSEVAIGGGFQAGSNDPSGLDNLNVGQSEGVTTFDDRFAARNPRGWAVSITNNGVAQAYFFSQSICASDGSATLHVVQHSSVGTVTLKPGESGSSTANCAGDDVIASGGFVAVRSSDGSFDQKLTVGGSEATHQGITSPTAWTVAATNNDTVNVDLAARVMCMSGGPVALHAVERGSVGSLTLAPGASGSSTATCRTDEMVTGGGYVARRSRGGSIEHSVTLAESEVPGFGAVHGWAVYVTNHDTVNATVSARAMCVS